MWRRTRGSDEVSDALSITSRGPVSRIRATSSSRDTLAPR
jgi:hypothetical protein